MRLFILSITSMFMIACQSSDLSEYYGSLLNSPSGVVLEQSEHEIGWGKSDCLSCHSFENFHQVRSDRDPSINISAVAEYAKSKGLSSCHECHGDNGVP